MERYTGEYYRTRTTLDLNVLRSKKYNRVSALRKEVGTYTNLLELRKLLNQINWIDVELRSRADQLSFFE